ncbi:MAG: sacsin N-terminal ATP-binding-like domain-containing protein [Halobacteriaceae archaeon]
MDVDGESEAACVTDLRNSRLNTYREMPNDISSHYNDEGENEENYYGRFAYELIQNADDAVGKRDDLETPSKARFELHTGEDPCLIVANTGPPVDDEDTRALTTIGDTTKRDADRKATIGHKGRGFSAVLEITEQPYVFSTDVSFMFDRSRSRECIAEVLAEVEGWEMDDVAGIPLMRLPAV